jgi:hypothetical protein
MPVSRRISLTIQLPVVDNFFQPDNNFGRITDLTGQRRADTDKEIAIY